MSAMDVNQVLMQMRDLAARSGTPVNDNTGSESFADLLVRSIDSINETQQQAGDLAQAFETGESDASLSDVMISIQKANVSFQAMVQVRNKLVEAYKDVMNMPM
ncbi:MAG: flagellar hook-basal body complex protein FliE [Gammaproteobacteria bacterium]